MNLRQLLTLTVVLTIAAATTACGTKRQTGICASNFVPKASAKGDAASSDKMGDEAWAKRKNVEELKKAIAAWDKALQIDPKQSAVRVKLSRAVYLYGDGHLRPADEEEKMIAEFSKGQQQAELAFAQANSAYRDEFCAEKPFPVAIVKATKADVPAMYWYATNLGKWGLAKGLTTILKYKDDIKAMMDQLMKLDKAYFYHAPNRYFGVYYTKIPVFRGDKKLSTENFEASIAGAPQYLATKVLYAGRNLTKWKNRARFMEMLYDVRHFPISKAPELEAENTIEKAKAEELLDDWDTYFEPDDDAQRAAWEKENAATEAKAKAKYAAAAPEAAAPAAAAPESAAPAATPEPATTPAGEAPVEKAK
jgi:hypothetical protein